MIGAGAFYWWRNKVDTEAAPVKKTIAELAQDLLEAQVAFDEADKKLRMTQSTRTDRLNYLNIAQKSLDKAVEELRKGAPSESDWAQSPKLPDRRG